MTNGKDDLMSQPIKAIFLDLGDTLRLLIPDEAHQSHAKNRIAELVGTHDSPDDFCEKLHQRYKTYRVWAFENMAEAPEAEFWTRWMAPEFPPERIAPVAVELSFQYRQTKGRRIMAPDGKKVIEELYKRGYTLGIISNLITSNEVPDWLEEEGLTPLFQIGGTFFGPRNTQAGPKDLPLRCQPGRGRAGRVCLHR